MVGFSIPVFFVLFRECTEASIVVSVLYTSIRTLFPDNPAAQKQLFKSFWLGTALGLTISLLTAAGFLVVFFKYASNLWASSEALWEGAMSLIASVLMSVMAVAFLTSDKLTSKWQRKLTKALAQANILESTADDIVPVEVRKGSTVTERTLLRESTSTYTPRESFKRVPEEDENAVVKPEEPLSDFVVADIPKASLDASRQEAGNFSVEMDAKALRKGAAAFFWIPFVTVLREGLEGMVFLGGIGISETPSDIPLAVVGGILAGLAIGYFIYRAGNSMKMSTFFVSASIFILYLSAGLMSKAVYKFEQNTWNVNIGTMDSDMSSFYNVRQNVWHVDCCNPEDKSQGGWQLFNAILGWNNTATIGSVTSYILFWIVFSGLMVTMKLMERRRVALGQSKVSFKNKIKGVFSRIRA